MNKYTPPAYKRWGKFPRVVIEKPESHCEYQNFIIDNKDIDARIPPVWDEFVIEWYELNDGMTIKNEVLVQYDDEKTSFYATMFWSFADKLKRVMTIGIDYNTYDVETHSFSSYYADIVPSLSGDRACIEEEIKNIMWTVLGIQAYILYYKPEVIEEYVERPAEAGKPSLAEKEYNPQAKIKIKSSVKKRIVLSGDDTPSRAKITYHKFSWTVRGHYQMYGKGDNRKLKYIAPYTANRNIKKGKVTPAIYQVEQ